MSSDPARTIVVGVGGAGIEVLKALAVSDGLGWGSEYDEYFEYIAVDSDSIALERAPAEAAEVCLDPATDEFATVRQTYPFLTSEHEIGKNGTRSQRPVGRYTLDSRAGVARKALHDALKNAFESHFQRVTNTGPTQQCNIIHVYSMGGGTGSGTFPLVAHVIDRVTDDLREHTNVDIYLAGVGIIPELTYGVGQGFEAVVPPSDRQHFANAYAALRDLERVMEADFDESLPVYFYSECDDNRNSRFVVGECNSYDYIDRSPYRHCFLVGVDESRMGDTIEKQGIEPYYKMVDNTIVAAIYGLAAFGDNPCSWFPPPTGTAHFAAFGQTQLSVPIEDVRTYCELTARINELEERVGSGGDEAERGILGDALAEKQRERDILQRLAAEPAAVFELSETPKRIKDDIASRLDTYVFTGVDTTESDIESLLEGVEEFHGVQFLPYTLASAEHRIADSEGVDRADDDPEDERLKKPRESQAVKGDSVQLVQSLREHWSAVVEEKIEAEIERLEREIDELHGEHKEAEAELETVYSDREAIIERLTTPQYGQRLGRLELDEQKVRQELDVETLQEELTSLAAFHERGYLARDLQTVMENRVHLSYAWQSPLLTWSDDKLVENIGSRIRQKRELWMLHSEENSTLPDIKIIGIGQHTFRRSDRSSQFPQFQNPYTVQFMTYCLDAPLSALHIYAELDAAVGGRLDTLLEQWDDYRLAFAYPEWYGWDVRQYYDILTRVELPVPPELDVSSVHIEKEGDELKTWLSSHGLASYLWQADEWDRYEGYITTHGTERVGWKTTLAEYGLEYHDIRALVPNGEPVERWFSGEISWDELLAEVETAFAEQQGFQVEYINDRPS